MTTKILERNNHESIHSLGMIGKIIDFKKNYYSLHTVTFDVETSW